MHVLLSLLLLLWASTASAQTPSPPVPRAEASALDSLLFRAGAAAAACGAVGLVPGIILLSVDEPDEPRACSAVEEAADPVGAAAKAITCKALRAVDPEKLWGTAFAITGGVALGVSIPLMIIGASLVDEAPEEGTPRVTVGAGRADLQWTF